MANEASIQSGLQIVKGSLSYQSRPTAFQATVTGSKGPTPGAFAVAVLGTDVDLSELTTPGLCRIQNLDATNFVTYGVYDPDTTLFFPLGEVMPGESYVLRLSRHLAEEFLGTGTGVANNTFRFMADTAACNVLVEAFEV